MDNRTEQLRKVKEEVLEEPVATKSWKEILYELTGVDVNRCPECNEGRMILVETMMARSSRSP